MIKNQISIGLICFLISTSVQAETFLNVFEGVIYDNDRSLLLKNSHLREIEKFAEDWDNALVEYLQANNINLDGYIDQQNNNSRAFSEVNKEQINQLLTTIPSKENARNYFENAEIQAEFNEVYKYFNQVNRYDNSQFGNYYPKQMYPEDAFQLWIASKILILSSGISEEINWDDIDQLWKFNSVPRDVRSQLCIWFCCNRKWWRWFSS